MARTSEGAHIVPLPAAQGPRSRPHPLARALTGGERDSREGSARSLEPPTELSPAEAAGATFLNVADCKSTLPQLALAPVNLSAWARRRKTSGISSLTLDVKRERTIPASTLPNSVSSRTPKWKSLKFWARGQLGGAPQQQQQQQLERRLAGSPLATTCLRSAAASSLMSVRISSVSFRLSGDILLTFLRQKLHQDQIEGNRETSLRCTCSTGPLTGFSQPQLVSFG